MENINYVLAQLLSTEGHISVNKLLIKELGLNNAVLIAELLSEYIYWKDSNALEDEFFYSTSENIENNTGLTIYQQRTCINQLKSSGLLIVERRGLPAKNYFKIDFESLKNTINSRCGKNQHQDVKKINLNNTILTNNISNTNNTNNISNIVNDNSIQVYNTNYKNNNIKNYNNSGTAEGFLGSAKKQSKQSMYDKCISIINNFSENKVVRTLLRNFLDNCLENSKESNIPFYSTNFKGKINQLQKLPEEQWEVIIKNTLDNGWLNFYSLSTTKNKAFSEPDSLINQQFTAEDKKRQDEFLKEMEKHGKRTKF